MSVENGSLRLRECYVQDGLVLKRRSLHTCLDCPRRSNMTRTFERPAECFPMPFRLPTDTRLALTGVNGSGEAKWSKTALASGFLAKRHEYERPLTGREINVRVTLSCSKDERHRPCWTECQHRLRDPCVRLRPCDGIRPRSWIEHLSIERLYGVPSSIIQLALCKNLGWHFGASSFVDGTHEVFTRSTLARWSMLSPEQYRLKPNCASGFGCRL